MDRQEILDRVAPCSLCCYTCPAKRGGVIEENAKTLLKYYQGYDDFLSRVVKGKWKIRGEKRFIDTLENKTKAPCGGCRSGRNENCCIKGCFIFECTKEHGVDFCGECQKFPCDRAKALFSGVVQRDYLEGNARIKEVGAETFCREICDISHYHSWKVEKDK